MSKRKLRAWRYLDRSFWLVMVLLCLLGVSGLLGSVYWQSRIEKTVCKEVIKEIIKEVPTLAYDKAERIEKVLGRWEKRLTAERLWPIFSRDFFIALLIAVGITVSIELYAAKRLSSQVAEDVFEAIFRKVVPPEIYPEIRDHIFRATIMRRNWKISMTLIDDPNLRSRQRDCYLCKTIMTYSVESLLGYTHEHLIRSRLDLDITDSDLNLPRFDKVTIGNMEYEKEKLKKELLSEDGFTYKKLVKLPAAPHTPVMVINEISEIVRVPDTFVWSSNLLSDGIEIEINTTSTPDLKFEVHPLHPESGKLQETSPQRWVFRCGILPWQGFEIRSMQRA